MTASTTQASTRVYKGRDGWEARTIIGMGTHGRVLVIDTDKTTGGMVTRATVNTDNGDGMLMWEMFGDFSKRTLYKGARCTEKTVRDLHAQALSVSDVTMAEAAAFYAKKEPKTTTYPTDPSEYSEGASDPMDDVNYVGHPCHY